MDWILLHPSGKLMPRGVAFIRTEFDVPALDEAEIQRIFDPETQRLTDVEATTRWRWREAVVTEEMRQRYQAEPVEVRDGALVPSTAPSGLLADANRSRIIFVNRFLSTIWSDLARIDAIPVRDETFHVTGGPDPDLREWSAARLLAHALRDERDHDLRDAYVKGHHEFLRQELTDPVQMVRREDIGPADLVMRPITLIQFRGLADRSLDPESRRRFRGDLRYLSTGVYNMSPLWYLFLFGARNPPRIDNRQARRGENLVGHLDHGALYAALADPRSRCERIPAPAGRTGAELPLVGTKRPDTVAILLDQRKVEVLDATMRPYNVCHNFKTVFYATALRLVFRNIPGQDWTVQAVDFQSVRRMQMIGGPPMRVLQHARLRR